MVIKGLIVERLGFPSYFSTFPPTKPLDLLRLSSSLSSVDLRGFKLLEMGRYVILLPWSLLSSFFLAKGLGFAQSRGRIGFIEF